MKLALAANMTATMNGSGLTPSCSATPVAMGNTSTAAALLVITSVNRAVIRYTSSRASQGLWMLSASMASTSQAAVPLCSRAVPRAKAAPITTSTGRLTLTFMRARLTVTQRVTSSRPAARKAASSTDTRPITLTPTMATRITVARGARLKSGGVESLSGLTSMKSRRYWYCSTKVSLVSSSRVSPVRSTCSPTLPGKRRPPRLMLRMAAW